MRRSAAASTRRCAACSPTTWSSATARSPTTTRIRRRRGTAARPTPTAPRVPTRTRSWASRSSRRTTRTHFRGIDIMRAVRSFDPVPALRGAHVPGQGQDAQDRPSADVRRAQLAMLARAHATPGAARRRGRAAARASWTSCSTTRRPGGGRRPDRRAARALRGRAGADRRGDRRPRRRSARRRPWPTTSSSRHLLLLHGLHPVPLRATGCVARSARSGPTWSPTAATSSCWPSRSRTVRLRLAGQLQRLPLLDGHAQAGHREGHPQGGARDRAGGRRGGSAGCPAGALADRVGVMPARRPELAAPAGAWPPGARAGRARRSRRRPRARRSASCAARADAGRATATWSMSRAAGSCASCRPCSLLFDRAAAARRSPAPHPRPPAPADRCSSSRMGCGHELRHPVEMALLRAGSSGDRPRRRPSIPARWARPNRARARRLERARGGQPGAGRAWPGRRGAARQPHHAPPGPLDRAESTTATGWWR